MKYFPKTKKIAVVLTILMGLVLSMPLATIAGDADPLLPGKGVKFKPINDPYMANVFHEAILALALEELGYTWENKPQFLIVDQPLKHLSVAKGGTPWNAGYWYPNQTTLFKNAGGGERSKNPRMFIAGTIVNKVTNGYMIDKKTADKYNITNLSQFKDPKIAKLFDNDGDGKADLVGCIPGWSCADAINYHIEAYGLKDTVTQNQSPYNVMFADLLARYKRGESFFRTAWTPDWSHAELKPGIDTVWLDVPYSAWHIDPKLDTSLPDGSNTGFPTGSIKTFVNTKWANENPAAVKLMEILTVPAQACNEAIYITRQKGETFEIYFGLAEEWIAKNRDQMDAWVKEARAAVK
jgi:glycine betaine/proline transport system substrate-binding protein